MARVGQGFNFTDFNRRHPRVQRWRVGVQRELSNRMMVEASYWGQWATGSSRLLSSTRRKKIILKDQSRIFCLRESPVTA